MARLPPDRVPHSNPAGPEPIRRQQRRSGAALGPEPRAPAPCYPRAEPALLASSHSYKKGRFPHGEDPAGPHSATRQPRGKPDSGRSAALRPGPGSPTGGWSAISPPVLPHRDTELGPPPCPPTPARLPAAPHLRQPSAAAILPAQRHPLPPGLAPAAAILIQSPCLGRAGGAGTAHARQRCGARATWSAVGVGLGGSAWVGRSWRRGG